MKRFLKLLLLSPVILFSLGCNQNDAKPIDDDPQEVPPEEPVDLGPIDVVIISGQSNGVGCTYGSCIKRSIGAEKYQDYMYGFPGIKIAYDCWTKDQYGRFMSQNHSKDNNFVKTMLGQGNSLATFGPEIGIAEELSEEYSDKLCLIKFACGASNLKDDWLQRNSPMYPRLVSYVEQQIDNLKKAGYTPTIKAFCWMQGEGDSYDGYYQSYYENTKEFVSHVREDFKELAGNVDLPFIDAGISSANVWEYYREVNEAKQQFAEESEINFYIDTIGEGLHTNKEPFDTPDICHYDSESEILLGHLFAQNFKQFLSVSETSQND